MDVLAATRHYSCIFLLMVIVVIVTTDVRADTTVAASTIQPTTTRLTTLTPLESPKDVVLNAENTTSFSVKWTDVYTADDDVTYYITVSDGMVDEVLPNSISPTLITGKTPGQTYDVTVTAVRGQVGEDSAPQSITLSPSAVTNLMEVVAETNSSTVTASWRKGDGIVTGYRVSCSKGTAYPLNDLPANQMSASCSGSAIAGESVTVTVTALSGIEQSDSEMVPIVANPNPVESLAEKDTTTDSVTAEWNRPSSGLVDGYLVNCSTGTSETIGADTDPLEYMCSTNVIAGEVIIVTVQSISNTKPSTPKTVEITAVPNPVNVLFEVSATTDSVTAGWIAPSAGDFDGYELSCSPGTPVEESINRNTMQGTCATTEAGQVVVVNVTSTSNDKTSAVTRISITAVPNPVDALFEVSATTDSVTVGWIAPSAGDFDGFELSCSPGTPVEESINRNTMQGTCTTIEAGQVVVVNVTSTSNNKTSAVKSISITAVPDPVNVLFEVGATTGSVTAGWIGPSAGVYDGYELSCSPGNPDEENPSNDTTQGTCSTTEAGQIIVVRVSSTSDNKTSAIESISIAAVPDAVDDLRETDATTTSVTVGWVTPSGTVDSYTVGCTDGTASPSASISNDSVEASCVNVTPGSEVTVTISSIRGNKSTPAEQPVRAHPNAVDDLQESEATTSSVSVTWDRPVGELDRYDVYCSADTTGGPDGSVNDGATLEYTCTAGIAGDEVTVTVVTVSGGKENSDFTVVRALPNAVDNLQGSGATTSSVSVTWDQPDGTIERYDVYCTADTTGNPDGSVDNGDPLIYTCPAATAGGEVTITVVTVSGVKDNSASTVVRARPNAVRNLREISEDTTSVTAAWNEPVGIVSYYIVECSSGNSQEVNVTDDGSSTFSASCVGLETPGADYTMTVTSCSYGVSGASQMVLITAQPSKPFLTDAGATNSSITVQWNWNSTTNGEVDFFEAQCDNGTTPDADIAFDEDRTYKVVCEGLTPGGRYSVFVNSVSNEKPSEVADITVTAIPVGVALSASESTVSRVGASWPQPSGRVDSFRVECSQDAEPVMDSIPHDESEMTYEAFCNVSVPGALFSMMVTPVRSNESAGTSKIDLRASPESVENFTILDDYTTNQANLEWAVKDRCRDSGCVWDRYLIAYSGITTSGSESRGGNEVTVTFNDLVPGDLYSFNITVLSDKQESSNETTSQRMRPAEATGLVLSLESRQIIANWARPDAGSVTGYEVTIRETDSEDTLESQEVTGTTATFEELTPGVSYTVRVCSRSEDQSCLVGVLLSATTTIEEPLNPIAWIIPLVFMIMILVIVAAVFIWRKRQEPRKETSSPKSRTSDHANGGIDNHAFDNDRSLRRTCDSRPVKLGEFAAHFEEMSKDANQLFSEEYNDLLPIGKDQPMTAAELDENKVKNRFSNILPYDHTRVNLSPIANEPGSDYINANYMIGYDSPREYIACQGPLQNTEEDMWRMVWEQGASLIVMVTQLMERGKIKCHQYWPEDGEGPVQFGTVTVRPVGKEFTELWIIRKFIISRGLAIRNVLHYNFTGVPGAPEDLIKFVRAVRDVKKQDDNPIVVHCSAGVGLTGTFISLDTLMTTIEREDEVDIFGLVRKMRMNRCAMVQTEMQYILIHKCINALLGGASEGIYENQNGPTTEGNIYYNESVI